MSEITQNAIFAREAQRKLDEFIAWVIDNNPDKNNGLSRKDFADARLALLKIASGDVPIQHIEPEPEAGGAQYINDNPSPWP